LYLVSFIGIILLTIIISGYKLGSVPHGLTWDEAAIGYNGYAILTTRRDEWLVRLPVSFRSFGDYKAPLAIYTNGVFTYLFGLDAFGIRLPFMLAGVMSVVGIMLLVQLLWSEDSDSYLYSILAGFIAITTPWYVHYSRAGFESGLALCFTIWGVYFFLLFKKYLTSLPLVLSMVSFVLSLYTYHSSKVVTPLLVLLLLLFSRKEIFKKSVIWKVLGAGLASTILSYALIKDSLFGNGLERAGVTLFSQMDSWSATGTSLQQFMLHLLPGFLINGDTTTLRHGDGQWGVLLLPTYLIVMLALGWMLLSWRKLSELYKNVSLFSVLWLVIGILPAAIASEVPHSNRALMAFPAFLLLVILAFSLLKQQFFTELQKRLSIGLFILLQSLFFFAYLHDYFTLFAAQSASDFKDGYVEAFQIAREHELGLNGKSTVDKIVFASDYGQPYIYALLVRKTNPILYQGGSLIKYEFRDDINGTDLNKGNRLVVAVPEDAMGKVTPDYVVTGSDNQIKFKIYLTKN
ncbi:MAG: 2 protein, partial [Patescibacteria group bacterium]|nr:2 protein [Patescibacteria group bacterium]